MNEALVVCVRGIISFFTLFIFTKILGKQQIGEITIFDYILGITIGSFGVSLTSDLSSAAWPHWVGLTTWIVLGLILQFISLKSKRTSSYINDDPAIVIHDGNIIGDNLKKTKFTFFELLEQLRLKDIFDINELKFAIIEPNGKVSTLKKDEFENLISSMEIDNKKVLNNELIFNGIIIDDNLPKHNINRQWILDELKKQGLDSPVQVFFAYIDSSKSLKVYSYTDMVVASKDIFK